MPRGLTPRKLCAEFLPDGLAEDLRRIEHSAHRRRLRSLPAAAKVVFDRGPLRPAIAASIALPGIIRPVVIEDRVLVDGGATNPLPFDLLRGRRRCHRRRRYFRRRRATPAGGAERAGECLLCDGACHGHSIITEKLKHGAARLAAAAECRSLPRARISIRQHRSCASPSRSATKSRHGWAAARHVVRCRIFKVELIAAGGRNFSATPPLPSRRCRHRFPAGGGRSARRNSARRFRPHRPWDRPRR